MEVPRDDASRFVFGLYRDDGAIRVRRAETVLLGQVQEAHTRRVIAAWTAASRSRPDPAVDLAEVRAMPIRRERPFGARLRAAIERRFAP